MSEVITTNEYLLGINQTRDTPIIVSAIRKAPIITTRQAAYRYAAWLISMAELLPDETLPSTWEEVLAAVEST